MTTEETRIRFESFGTFCDDRNDACDHDCDKCKEMEDHIAEALEKQTPKKPKYKEFGASKYWDCPVCGEVVLSHIDGIPLKNEYNHSHCGGCGQAIDWTEEAEK